MRDQILVTGGNGKTGSRVVAQLRERGAEVRVAGRNPQGAGAVRFDWHDAATYDAALENVRAVYLVAPPSVVSSLEAMRPFLERALAQGVERFVLLSAVVFEEGGPMMGEVHAFLKANAPQWTALRPTWFMQNFSEQQHLATIRDENMIYSATGDGRVPFIDANDIAAVAVEALLSPLAFNRGMVLTGPQLLSYDDVARIIAQVTGEPVIHRNLSEAELAQQLISYGIGPEYAPVLAAMDTSISHGSEDYLTSEVQNVTGRAPNDFATFAVSVRDVWEKKT